MHRTVSYIIHPPPILNPFCAPRSGAGDRRGAHWRAGPDAGPQHCVPVLGALRPAGPPCRLYAGSGRGGRPGAAAPGGGGAGGKRCAEEGGLCFRIVIVEVLFHRPGTMLCSAHNRQLSLKPPQSSLTRPPPSQASGSACGQRARWTRKDARSVPHAGTEVFCCPLLCLPTIFWHHSDAFGSAPVVRSRLPGTVTLACTACDAPIVNSKNKKNGWSQRTRSSGPTHSRRRW